MNQTPTERIAPASRTPLRVLILEDNPSDADLMVDALQRAGFEPQWERVESEQDFAARLTLELELILSDYSLPQFNGVQALKLVRSRGLDVPFILVSGSIGEDIAVEAMRNGADDYLLKDRMARLGAAVLQALERSRLRTEKQRAEAALSASEANYRHIFEGAAEGIMLTAINGRVLAANPAFARMLGYASPEELMAGVSDVAGQIYTDREQRSLLMERLMREQEVRGFEVCFRRKNGSPRWASLSARLTGDEHDNLPRILSMAVDITERMQAELSIRRLNRLYAVLSGINTLIVRVRSRQELFNEACLIAATHGGFGMVWIGLVDAKTLEVTPAAWAGFEADDEWAMLKTTARDTPQGQGSIGRAIREKKPVIVNDMTLEPAVGGERRTKAIERGFRSAIALPLIVEGKISGTFSLFAKEPDFFNEEEVTLLTELSGDISFALQTIEKQEKLDYLSYYDVLTGLPNRTLFLDRVNQELHARGDDHNLVALILIDIERFRLVNEALGRHGGDELLKLIAQRLEQVFDGKDSIARVGADGYSAMLRGIPDAASVAHKIESMIEGCYRTPFAISGRELRVSAKIGIAMYPADGGDADTLYGNAEAALKRAKATGNRYLFYDAEMNARAAQALSMETRLRKAVEAQQFVLHYQPKVELAGGGLCGFEALIRWQDPESGLVPPATFIPLLEETGLIIEVGRWALVQALADHDAWTARGHTVPRVAVNVSAIQLQQHDFVDRVSEIVRRPGTSVAIELEITESLIMQDVEASIRKLSLLQQMGVHIALDDFGTGYSSLSYVTRLPINSLKIDRSLMSGMTNRPEDMTVVSSVIALAHSLDLRVVAEGVETEEQAQMLRLLRCDEAQGYLFSKPIPADQIEPLLRAPTSGMHQRGTKG